MRIFKHRCQYAYFVAILITKSKTITYNSFATLKMKSEASCTENIGIRAML